MDYTWNLSNLRCLNCGDVEHIKVIMATESGEEMGFIVLCTNCHIEIVSEASLEDFWKMINDTPATETGN